MPETPGKRIIVGAIMTAIDSTSASEFEAFDVWDNAKYQTKVTNGEHGLIWLKRHGNDEPVKLFPFPEPMIFIKGIRIKKIDNCRVALLQR